MARADLQLFAGGLSTLDPAAFAPAGVIGADKVAARFVYFLANPDTSPFLGLLGAAAADMDLFAAFAAGAPAAETACRAAQDADDPPAERFGSAELLTIALAGDSATMTVLVKAADGAAATAADFTLEL